MKEFHDLTPECSTQPERRVEESVNFNQIMLDLFIEEYKLHIGGARTRIKKFDACRFDLRQFCNEVLDYVLMDLNDSQKGKVYDRAAKFTGYSTRQIYRR